MQIPANHEGYALAGAVFTMRFHDNGDFDESLKRWKSRGNDNGS